ncbi:lysostaphin resistance A-like protein, partial [Chloroflexota bacterium]
TFPAALLIMAIIAGVINRLMGYTVGTAGIYNGPLQIGVLVVTIIIFAPIAEETFYRKYLQARLENTKMKILGAVTITSALFVAMHVPRLILADSDYLPFSSSLFQNLSPVVELVFQLSGIFWLSILFGWIYHKTNNLLVVTIGHALWNATMFVPPLF